MILCSGPMVWYQKFEYAVGHWLQKTAEHVFGSVLCSPGCFSLFRGSALMDDNVLKRYTTTSSRAAEYVQYDQGWHKQTHTRLCLITRYLFIWLMPVCFRRGGSLVVYFVTAAGMAGGIQCCIRCIHQLTTGIQGVLQPEEEMGALYASQYSGPSAQVSVVYRVCSIYSPVSWLLRPAAYELFCGFDYSGAETVKRNSSISKLYIFYQMFTVGSSILGPASVTLMIAGRVRTSFWLSNEYSEDISYRHCIPAFLISSPLFPFVIFFRQTVPGWKY